jgi:uncharacterized protein YndB with AHSA1/START domain
MRWLLFSVTLLFTLAAAVAVIGALLPIKHVSTSTAELSAPPDRVWSILTDILAFPLWRPGVTRVELLTPSSPTPTWREISKEGTMTYQTTAAEPPTRLVTRIADRGLPFGGEWEYTLTPTPTGTRVTITERGEIYNPIFRFVARFFLGYTATMEAMLRALSTRVGAPPATP